MLAHRDFEHIYVDCKICPDSCGYVGPKEMHKILCNNLCYKGGSINTEEFDINWTENQYGHIIWRMACY